MPITALDKDTVRLITTTQVITSVANAVKELIENALDANARNIEINLTDRGSSLIEVKDDGCGIPKQDSPCMALSSYTSKISNFSDLDSLQTYGFRGEALSALCAMANVVITTKTDEDDAATVYTLDRHGRIVKSEQCHRPTGTTVQVKDLFKEIPVRRQMITDTKKAGRDIKLAEALIKSYAICKYFVRINYRVDKNVIFAKPAASTMREAAAYVLGKRVVSNMSWIEEEDVQFNMRLMVPSKEVRDFSEICLPGAQYIFVNDRPVKHKELEKMLSKTIMEGLKQDSSSKKPVFLLHILTDAENIDVNLDPNKTSIFFKERQIVLDAIERRLKTFYGIEVEEPRTEDVGNDTSKAYQDYTQNINPVDLEEEWPACKKRKLETDIVEESVPPKEQEPTTSNLDDLMHRLPPPDLSDSDSNDTKDLQSIEPINNSHKNVENTAEDSPVFELSPSTPVPMETLSQLPVVDLGDDFCWNDTHEKENRSKDANERVSSKSEKTITKKNATLEAWSKGHVLGLKGGTDVEPYVSGEQEESPEMMSMLKDESFYGKNTCKGFLMFSRHIRSQITKENPTLTVPQIAVKITSLWKKMSPEERGYYRDLAREKQQEEEEKKKEKRDKPFLDLEKNKKRLLGMLEKMKNLKVESKENLVMRTTVPWDMELRKVSESFRNRSSCESTRLVIGRLYADLWIVQTSAHIWLLDAAQLKKELNVSDSDWKQEDAENVEQLLKRWLSEKDDLSPLHPIHSLPQNPYAQ